MGAVALVAAVVFLVQTAALSTPQPFSRDAFTPLLKTSPVDETATAADRWIALDENGGTLRQTGMNFGALWGVPSVSGVGPLPPWREFEVLQNAEAGTARAMIEQVGASRVVVRTGTPLEASLLGAGLGRVRELDGLTVLAAPETPVAFLAKQVRYVDAAAAIAAARRGHALQPDPVLIEATPAGTEEYGDHAGHVETVAADVGSRSFRVDVARPTWLVVREPYYPSWRATIDGTAAEVRPAGAFFLAVRVAAGEHDVALAYHEPRVAAGIVLLVLAAITLAVAGRRTA